MPVGGFGGRRLAAAIGPVAAWSWSLNYQPAAQTRALLGQLEGLGYPMVWIPEVVGSKEILAHAGIALASSERLVVGTGIANIYARDPMAMANGALALGEAWPGRFVLGLGVSSERSVNQRGRDYGPPLSTMRAYLDAMASATYAGPAPARPVPLVLAAIGPRMLELAAERADGAHPFFAPVEHTAWARKIIGPEPCLAVAVPVVLATNLDEGRRVARSFAGHYLTLPHHRANLARFGFGEADLEGHGSDRLIDTVVAIGPPQTILDRVAAQHAAGADQVALMFRSEAASDPGFDAWRDLAAGLGDLTTSRNGSAQS
jgi:probable F420-dependent oxidoreductase